MVNGDQESASKMRSSSITGSFLVFLTIVHTATPCNITSQLMDDVHLSTARHFQYELRLLGGKFSAAIWSAGGVPRITNFTAISH